MNCAVEQLGGKQKCVAHLRTVVADKLHEDALAVRLDPDGSSWPIAFHWFFVLEMCGLAGLCIGLSQLGTLHQHSTATV
jgi:hypothetical protein